MLLAVSSVGFAALLISAFGRSDVERVPIERLQAFYKTWYQPDNAVLIVAGRFDPATLLEQKELVV